MIVLSGILTNTVRLEDLPTIVTNVDPIPESTMSKKEILYNVLWYGSGIALIVYVVYYFYNLKGFIILGGGGDNQGVVTTESQQSVEALATFCELRGTVGNTKDFSNINMDKLGYLVQAVAYDYHLIFKALQQLLVSEEFRSLISPYGPTTYCKNLMRYAFSDHTLNVESTPHLIRCITFIVRNNLLHNSNLNAIFTAYLDCIHHIKLE
jgi:hypothetical protein